MRACAAATAAAALVAAAAGAAQPVVVIDPGHDLRANGAREPIGPGSERLKIKDGGGTRGVVTGTREADLVLDVSLRLRSLLRQAGVRVVMTRTRTARTSAGNVARARVANTARAALFLRVHADGHPDRSVRGTHTLHPVSIPDWTDDIAGASRRAAGIVQREVVRALGFPDRGLNPRSDFTGFNWSDVPVILVELGFMTNPDEDRALARPATRQRAAGGLCRGVLRFLERATGICARSSSRI